jgi:protein TonB
MVMPVLTAPEQRPGGRRAGRPWLDLAVILSALTHGLILAIIILARRPVWVAPPPPDSPGFEMVFQGGEKSPHAVPVPGRHIEIPNGEAAPNQPVPPTPQAPPPPQAAPAPEVNLLPPEMRMMAPPQQQADVQAAQREAKAERRRRERARTAPSASPFANPQPYSFASRPSSSAAHGLHASRSLNLALGLMVQGGQLKDAVPHVSSPGADGDYLEQLSEYIETHKFYPEQAAANRESGVAVIKATIARDGTVKDVRLVESSGSRTLDLAWLSLFRDKHLVPFPDDMKAAQQDFTLSMDYQLLYR